MALLVLLLRLFLMVGGCSATVRDSYWDCQFRQLAATYARDIVLAPAAGWAPNRAHAALATVAHGLNLSECNLTHTPFEDATSPLVATAVRAPGVGVGGSGGEEAGGGVTVYVSTSGSDAAAGTAAAPLKTVAGAQAWIRARYPVVWSRPAITVAIQPGEFTFGEDTTGHHVRATR